MRIQDQEVKNRQKCVGIEALVRIQGSNQIGYIKQEIPQYLTTAELKREHK
jgi:hypothetical protein